MKKVTFFPRDRTSNKHSHANEVFPARNFSTSGSFLNKFTVRKYVSIWQVELSFSWIRPIIKIREEKRQWFAVGGGPGKSFLARVRRTRGLPANRKNWNGPVRRQIFDNEGHAHFITFSYYRRRRLLDDNQAKGIVVHFLSAQLINQGGNCIGFVVMPDHVHALVRFHEVKSLSVFMSQWKRRSSIQLKRLYSTTLRHYGEKIDLNESVWQPRYYSFNVFSTVKVRQKLDYMHNNPVKAGLVGNSVDWPYSSARWYLLRRPVGVKITPIM